MFSIRHFLLRSAACKTVTQSFTIQRAAFRSTAITLEQQQKIDMSSPNLSQKIKAPTGENLKPLPNVDVSISKEPASRLLSIHNLPNTATKEDILRLARLAFHDVDSVIQDILFVRSQELQFQGRVLVLFKNAGEARHFQLFNDRAVVGGNQLRLSRVDTKGSKPYEVLQSFRKSEMYSSNGNSAAGRTVVLSGFPLQTKTFHVSKWLHSKGYYPEDEEENAIIQVQTKQQALVSKFFIRFPSESDAWRAVRRFHNVTFRPTTFNNRYKIRAAVAY
ncbi:hypothetical protein BGW37DRAFT_510506 [Umbelopsis sp. PMI_123]|nr:hypothetical protein BGW37DRAFT_510506 [Umbelopsis sp. PMI_123]